ncbi:YheV family putative zinc ribbon protein [Agarivorans sp. MS3-6]|uniref:YheV family putative zinc ribbon protein n=1 Tax=Agarivorans sp. TSD2052 TaxID=2937286 RepID=UPI00200CDA77|nr:YheV family putative zinc ribbon protein [Agarivorans sp. TSD2052]UPW18168.1 YheV family putative metal-binding protein [Agarivorans sp. TSD2052]
MARHRFIAGAVCPECGEQDSIRLIVEQHAQQESEHIECVSCDYHAERPKQQEPSAEQDIIGLFKP